MAGRHEMKYALNEIEAVYFEKKLERLLDKDEHCRERNYHITSLYFDTWNNQAYKEKEDGDAVRHKYRIRFYNDSPAIIKLERKSKIDSLTVKDSASLTSEEVRWIIEGEYGFLLKKDETIYRHFYVALRQHLLRPKVLIRYERKAFIHKIGDMRVTFDRQLQESRDFRKLFQEPVLYRGVPGSPAVILEVKFNHVLPAFMKGIVQTAHTISTANSKYVLSRAPYIY